MIYLLNTALAKKSILKTYLEIVFAELILRSKKKHFLFGKFVVGRTQP
jgi:hypothetical protein